jgi:hypothetical protein
MGNDPKVPKDFIQTELQSKVGARSEHTASSKAALSRTTIAGVLMAAAIAALAVTSLIHSNRQATAQIDIAPVPARVVTAAPNFVPPDSGDLGPFAFGYLEFDWDPARGVPGFSAVLPKSRQQ